MDNKTYQATSQAVSSLQEQEDIEDELMDGDPECKHEMDKHCMSGVRCVKCGGWFCF